MVLYQTPLLWLLIYSTISTTNYDPIQTSKEESNRGKQLVAWNCDLKQNLEYSEYSLMKVRKCENISQQYEKPISKYGQIIKARRFSTIEVLECILKASFYTSYCSYNLLSGYRQWDSQEQISSMNLELSLGECKEAISSHTLKYQDRTYYAKMSYLEINLTPDNTASGWLTLRGKSDAVMGTCLPESFKLGREIYSSHVLQMKYDISIKRIKATFNVEKRLIRVSDHLVIPNSPSGTFFSPKTGNYHWNTIHNGNLTNDHWLEITKGNVSLYFPTVINSSMPIGIITTFSTGSSLAFSLRDQTTICISHSCREAFSTQLKDVYLIIYEQLGQNHWPLEHVGGSEINRLHNLEATLTSVYLSQELRLTNTFERISLELCERNREIILSNIQDYINNVLIQQDNNGIQGRYFIRAGSVLYAIKCVEDIAWLRSNTTNCYEHAPIYYKDKNNKEKSGFIDPITYVIQPSSASKPCNDILPFKFNLMSTDGSTEWYCRTTNGWDQNCKAPNTLAPLNPGNLYVADDKIIQANLYSEVQMESLHNFQWEKTETDADLKEWEIYIKQIKAENPHISVPTYFENLKHSVGDIIGIFTTNYWIQLIMKQLMPIIIINYLFNNLLGLIRLFVTTKKNYNKVGLNSSLIIKSLIGLASALFPIFSIPIQYKNKNIECRCNSEDFVEDLIKKIEDKERQRFLRNLQL